MLALIMSLLVITTSLCAEPIKPKRKAIVIGASAGIGCEIARQLAREEGYTLGLVSRNVALLESLREELGADSFIKQIDVTETQAREKLQELITQMGGLDLMVICINPFVDNGKELGPKEWVKKERILDVVAIGFIAMADIALEFFKQQGSGHLVGISSTSGQRGIAAHPEYSAAKACVSYYMEAQRNYMIQNGIDITITDVVAGYVVSEHSPLGQGLAAHWKITRQEAGETIIEGIKRKKKIVYVSSSVWVISWLLRNLPDYIYNNYLPWL